MIFSSKALTVAISRSTVSVSLEKRRIEIAGPSGAAGGNVSVAGSVAIAIVTTDTLAALYATVHLTGGDLTITAASNVISSLTAEVDDGTLVLDSDLGALGPTLIRYELTVRSLDRVRITGSGSVSGAGAFGRTGTIEIRGSGSATLTGVETDDLTVTVVGSGDVTVEGASESLQLTLDGSADVDAGDLRTKTASASLRGSADARVHVSEDLDATVSGSSELVYTGDPAQITRGTSGSGEIAAG